MKQLSELACVVGMICCGIGGGANGQLSTEAPKPITVMPYSPSLDLANLDRGADPCVDFLVGMAQRACNNARPENLRLQAATDPHPPGFARINGGVSDMPEFAEAFSCKQGQPMVRAKACKVW